MSSSPHAVSGLLRTPDNFPNDETALADEEAVRGAIDKLTYDGTCEMEVRVGTRTLFVHAIADGIVCITLLHPQGRPCQNLIGSPGARGSMGMRHGNGEEDPTRARYATKMGDARKALDYFLDCGDANPSLQWEDDDGTGFDDDDDDDDDDGD